MKKNIFLLNLLLITFCSVLYSSIYAQSISFTFDDGTLGDRPGYSFEKWNAMLLKKLRDNNVKATLFVTGKGKDSKRGKHLLESWNNDGHSIANHTYTHPNYNSSKVTFEQFKNELLKNDSLIKQYSNYQKYFRFPYLKEGNSKEKIESFRNFLKEQNYKNGYVTIDASDWYIDSRLIKKLRTDSSFDINKFRKFYLEHIWNRAQFYEKISFELTGRHIKHNVLLHHNLAAALFIDDLIQLFKEKGWTIVSTKEAYTDPIYNQTPNYAGESLIYALAKDSKKYEAILRYPAEDSRYEKEKMNKLGL
ncbi:polysaccharide deacetylase family protein [Tenacibaculum larymnensis]|uniref:Polysaccharide deacetylase family protein n=1 Tax=Tenacibaculum larymnensis TaxID=2878201 RepID=A0A9X4EUV8_9FLAO|nr:polysaccharide deacetylase family protein [Tenacibaculum larymnensis]MDE1206746.1 polysaccharide deacetylase family protein [Tenacibaculum larymnensis]